MPTIPIRVLPGATELILDPASKAYHLNVGFNLSFSVKELVEAIATLDGEVNIKVGANVPVGPSQPAPQPQRQNPPGIQGEFRPRDMIVHPKIDANWDTKLYNLSKAALDYRQKVTYATHDAAKFMKVYEEGGDPPKPAGQAPARPATAPTASPQSNAPIAKQGAVATNPGAAGATAPGAPAGAAGGPQPGKPPDMKDDCKTQ